MVSYGDDGVLHTEGIKELGGFVKPEVLFRDC